MIIREALQNDSEQLIQFFSEISVKANLEYKIQRHTDFFATYKMQTSLYKTFLMQNLKNKKIEGCATFLFKDVIFENEPRRIAFATDLRVAPKRAAIFEWSQHFLPTLKQLREEFKCNYFFSCLNLSDTQPINTFIRSRNSRRQLPRFHHFRQFQVVTMHGLYPWGPTPLKGISIEKARSIDLGELTNYLNKKSQNQIFHTEWRIHTLFERIKRWKNLKLENFLIARSFNGDIVGCVAPWNGYQVQDLIPIEYPRIAENFRQFLKFGKYLGLSHPITKSVKKSGLAKALSINYLTHLQCDNHDIFASLLHKVWQESDPDQFLAYLNFSDDFHLRPPEHWISVMAPWALYSLVPPDEQLYPFLSPFQQLSPELEPCFL
jgi:hypothetical protein